MQRTILIAIALFSGIAAAQDAPAFKTQKDKISYALGMDLGSQLRKLSIDVDPVVFGQALRDALSGGKMLMTEGQVRSAISELQAEQKRKEAARRKGTGEESEVEAQLLAAYNKKTGEAFLAENKKKPGVVSLPSGLQYRILKEGTGPKPKLDDTVTCHYRATLLNGTELYNSHKREEPAALQVKGVIKALSEALQLMPAGSKWQLFIPPGLAYGETGAGAVGPNATITYELELLGIK